MPSILKLTLTPKGKKFKTHMDDRRTEYSKCYGTMRRFYMLLKEAVKKLSHKLRSQKLEETRTNTRP